MMDKFGANLVDAVQVLFNKLRGPGGLGAQQCEALAKMLALAGEESRLMVKEAKVLSMAIGEAKETLLRCRAPDGDLPAREERFRVIGSLEDMLRAYAETEGLRTQWLVNAVADVARETMPPGGGGKGKGGGVLTWKKGSKE